MIDEAQLNFSPGSLVTLNVILALMMFGVSLGLSPQDFRRILRAPTAPAIGLTAQFLLLPFLTYLLTRLLQPHPSLALGMILVSACPGGNFSNIMTFLARGNLAVSVSMTAVSSLLAVIMTPLNFWVYARLNPSVQQVMSEISIPPVQMVGLVLLVIGMPLVVGMFVGQRFPVLRSRSEHVMRRVSLAVFLIFVGIAFSRNWDLFVNHAGTLAVLVIVHNLIALGLGFTLASVLHQPEADRRAITLEVGIQNSGLGLTLLFTFMPSLGGAILITAFWGVWHLVSGLLLAGFWGRRPVPVLEHTGDA